MQTSKQDVKQSYDHDQLIKSNGKPRRFHMWDLSTICGEMVLLWCVYVTGDSTCYNVLSWTLTVSCLCPGGTMHFLMATELLVGQTQNDVLALCPTLTLVHTLYFSICIFVQLPQFNKNYACTVLDSVYQLHTWLDSRLWLPTFGLPWPCYGLPQSIYIIHYNYYFYYYRAHQYKDTLNNSTLIMLVQIMLIVSRVSFRNIVTGGKR